MATVEPARKIPRLAGESARLRNDASKQMTTTLRSNWATDLTLFEAIPGTPLK
jgi:hypothetical protein